MTTWRILRQNSYYRRIFFAQVICQGGDWFTMIPLILLMQRLTGSGTLGAVLLGVETFVIAGLSLVAGSVLDRFDRRGILILSMLGSSIAVGLLFLVTSAGTAWFGVATYALLAVGKSFFTPAVNTVVPDIVEPRGLLAATTGLGSVWGVMLVVGSALGGVVSSFVSPYVCFGVTFLGYLVAGLTLTRLPKLPVVGKMAQRPRFAGLTSDVRAVFREAKRNRAIGSLILAKPGTNIGNGVLAVFPSVALVLSSHKPELIASLLYAARGVGALIGPIVARRAVHVGLGLRTTILIAVACFGAAYVLMSFQTLSWLAISLVVLAHVGGSATASLSSYGLQTESPAALRGRIFSIDNMLSMLAIGVSQLVAAILIAAMPGQLIILTFGLAVLAYAFVWHLLGRQADGR